MPVSIGDPVSGPRDVATPADGDAKSRETIAILEELLTQSILLRDLYKKARWQTADVRYRRLRRLFDSHYKEQLQLVDILVDRIRILGGDRQLFASNFLQGTQFACAQLNNKAASRLLHELLDAHESVLNTGRPNGSSMPHQWAQDFAVGQVVLTNDAQSSSISDQLMGVLRPHAGAVLAYE